MPAEAGGKRSTGESPLVQIFVRDNNVDQALKALKKKCNDLLVEAIDPSDEGVRGVNGLRVVDASVFPKIIGTFPVLGFYMMAEKAADDILADAT